MSKIAKWIYRNTYRSAYRFIKKLFCSHAEVFIMTPLSDFKFVMEKGQHITAKKNHTIETTVCKKCYKTKTYVY